MKIISNNKGLTLVEIVLAIVILGISGLMLATTFSSAMRIINRATLYKNISTSAASAVELEDAEDAISKDAYGTNIKEENATLTITYTKNGETDSTNISGQFMFGSAGDTGANAQLKYKEFLPSNYSYDIPADPVNN